MIIIDTSALFALFVAADRDHRAVADLLTESDDGIVVSPYVVAELDYLIAKRGGVRDELTALNELCSGAYELPIMGVADLISCSRVIARYADQRIGLTDASLVVLADRYQTPMICTFKRRHFSVLRSLDDREFTLIP